jgi:large subunit ribosomal protein L28
MFYTLMVKKCNITNVKPMSGNNVSHAVNKTKRRFLPNLQNVSFFSEILGKNIRLKVTSKGIKTVEKNGGIDNYILGLKNSLLNDQTRKIKKILSTKKPS